VSPLAILSLSQRQRRLSPLALLDPRFILASRIPLTYPRSSSSSIDRSGPSRVARSRFRRPLARRSSRSLFARLRESAPINLPLELATRFPGVRSKRTPITGCPGGRLRRASWSLFERILSRALSALAPPRHPPPPPRDDRDGGSDDPRFPRNATLDPLSICRYRATVLKNGNDNFRRFLLPSSLPLVDFPRERGRTNTGALPTRRSSFRPIMSLPSLVPDVPMFV